MDSRWHSQCGESWRFTEWRIQVGDTTLEFATERGEHPEPPDDELFALTLCEKLGLTVVGGEEAELAEAA